MRVHKFVCTCVLPAFGDWRLLDFGGPCKEPCERYIDT